MNPSDKASRSVPQTQRATSTQNSNANASGSNSNGTERRSLWGNHLKITRFQVDPTRWNKDWEKHLRTLSASDALLTMRALYRKDALTEGIIAAELEKLKLKVLEGQKLLADIWADVEEGGHFVTAWLLLPEAERKRHLMKGIEESISKGTFREDCRALCPEITTTALMKQRGQPYLEALKKFSKGKAEAGGGNVYHFPSSWWDSAKDHTPDETIHDMAYTLLTLDRDYFIG